LEIIQEIKGKCPNLNIIGLMTIGRYTCHWELI
jgi:uncharacterized pyridoxal phosphate-containing UPF0001 family protein